MEKHESKALVFVKKAAKRYFIDAMGAMALGLFASLIIGLILSQLSQASFLSWLKPFSDVVSASSPVVGAAIGVACAHGLKVRPLVMFSSAVTGAIGYSYGGPVGCFCAAVAGAEVGNLLAGKTPVDIVLLPTVTIIVGGLVGQLVGPWVNALMTGLGTLINNATELAPVPMGILVASLMGVILTAPISSAAIAIALGLDGLAAGAAVVGCCAHMMGFAVMSYRENGFGGFLAQGLGTSMLQIPNMFKNPLILIPPTLASAILGPISSAVLKMTNIPLGAGMGTSGLVGQFGAWTAMAGTMPTWLLLVEIAAMHFVLPALLTWLISLPMRKWNLIKENDLKLNLK
ncbi:MAG: PTS transporter subunit IIC [Christensenellales bacterium]|jgi:uncharacterized membrane protein